MRAFVVLTCLLAAAPSLDAQGSPAPIKFGKWALLAGSVGLNVAAANAHADAERSFDAIRTLCGTDQSRCDVDGEGRYLDPLVEALYQETLQYDDRARGYMLGGQAALLGAAVLFVWEFTRPKAPPENIPFAPTVSFRAHATDIGVRVPW